MEDYPRKTEVGFFAAYELWEFRHGHSAGRRMQGFVSSAVLNFYSATWLNSFPNELPG
jgi:hypothetical protein